MRRMIVLFFVLFGLAASAGAGAGAPKAAASGAQAAPPPRMVYLKAGKLLDVRSGRMLSDQVVVIRGDRIERVAPAGEVPVPAGAKVIDLGDATVLPGLIDAHEHIFLTGEANGRYDEQLLKESWQYRTIEAIVNAKKDLLAGFTSMRDCETEGAMYSDVDVEKAIDRALIPGPRLEVATRAMSVTGSYPLLGYSPEVTVPTGVQIADGPWQARTAVREQIKYGADFIKVYSTGGFRFTAKGRMVSTPTFTLDELKAIVDETHRWGRKVACHAYGDPGLRNCVDAGVDSIEHGLDLSDYDIQQMKAKGIWLVPTLYVYSTVEAEDLKLSHGLASRASIHEISFKKALAAGVNIAFGTDAGPFPHGTQAIEFAYMVKYGMTPLAAIQAATLNAAQLMDAYDRTNWSENVGAIEPGKYADLVAVRGNPLENVTLLEHIGFVMKGGEVVRDDFAN